MSVEDVANMVASNPQGSVRLYWKLGFKEAAMIVAKEADICPWCALAPLGEGQRCDECGSYWCAEAC